MTAEAPARSEGSPSGMTGRIIGNYRIVGKVGEGGMGVLYLAEHRSLPKKYAVKSLLPEFTANPKFKERFRNEARNQARLEHPNIVDAVDYLELGNEFFFVMNYVDGEDLSHLIVRRGFLPEPEALTIFKGILEGLGFAHRKGVIHRDMKPSNVLIDRENRPRITDFGIAILAGGKRLTTGTGGAVGTAWYMSREQILRPDRIDHRTDIYSAGIILYEMLTGKVPFDGETEYIVQEQQCNAAPPDPKKANPALGDDLVKILLKSLAKEPSDRFQSCEEFLEAIRHYERAVLPAPATPLWRYGLPLVLLSLIMMTGSGAYLWWREWSTHPLQTATPPDAHVAQQAVRETAALHLVRATEKAGLACRELARANVARTKIRAGLNTNETAELENTKARLRDYEKNIAEWSADYRDSLVKLRDLANDVIVLEEFDTYTGQLTQDKAFQRLPYLRLVKRHYQELLQGHAIAVDIGESLCAEMQISKGQER